MLKSILKFVSRNRNPLLIFAASRTLIFLVFYLVTTLNIGNASFTQWDAHHYLSIADHGYINNGRYLEEGSYIAFFPLFPLVIRAFAFLSGLGSLSSAIFINLVIGFSAAVLLYKLVEEKFGPRAALSATFLFSFYPATVFLTVPYTESLFIFLVLTFFYFIRRNKLAAAGATAGLVLITRLTGIVLIPVLFYELIKEKRYRTGSILGLLLSGPPILSFLIFQYFRFGTPLAFLEAQKINWYHQPAWPWQGFWLIAKNAFYGQTDLLAMWRMDLFFVCLMILTLIMASRKIEPAMLIFGWAVILLSLSQTFILGTTRYMMSVIPFYIYWSHMLDERFSVTLSIAGLFAGIAAINAVSFFLSRSLF